MNFISDLVAYYACFIGTCSSVPLYFASSGTNILNTNCTSVLNPCTEWTQILNTFQNGDVVYFIGNNSHIINSTFEVLSVANGAAIQNYTFIGQGKQQTIIELTNDTDLDYLFYIQAPYVDGGYVTVHLQVSDWKFVPSEGMDQSLLFGRLMSNITFDNIVFNMEYSDSTPSKDMVYAFYCDFISLTNIEIWDAVTADYDLFYLEHPDGVYLENITILPKTIGNDNSDIEIAFIDYVQDSQVIVENLYIENYYTSKMMWFRNCDHSTIYINNITINNVYGGEFWYFNHHNDVTITMNEICMNGYGRELSLPIVYWTSNFDSSVIYFINSIYENYMFGTTVKGFRFYEYGDSNVIHFNNVIFKNMVSTGNFGLIIIEDNFQIMINNCTFKKNINFTSMIQCLENSQCIVNITDTLFHTNIGAEYNGIKMINGIILETNAYGSVYIESSTFIGASNSNRSLWYDSDSKIQLSSNDNVLFVDEISSFSPTSIPSALPTDIDSPTNEPSHVSSSNPTFMPTATTSTTTDFNDSDTSVSLVTSNDFFPVTQSTNNESEKETDGNGDDNNDSLDVIVWVGIVGAIILLITCVGVLAMFLFVKNKDISTNGRDWRKKIKAQAGNGTDKTEMRQMEQVKIVNDIQSQMIGSQSPTVDDNGTVVTGSDGENDFAHANAFVNHTDGQVKRDGHDDISIGHDDEYAFEGAGDNETNLENNNDNNIDRDINIRKANEEYENEMAQRFTIELNDALQVQTQGKQNFGEQMKQNEDLEEAVMDDIIDHMKTSK